jgi:hypothetical protein
MLLEPYLSNNSHKREVFGFMMSSMRLFFSLPSAVALSATGLYFPLPADRSLRGLIL